MGDDRELASPLGCAVSAAIASVFAYGHNGSIVHRSTWDRQNLWLPILYAMCPHIYPCQLLLNALLSWDRRCTIKRIYGAARRREGFTWYLCAFLGLHTNSRAFSMGARVFIAGYGLEKGQGMLRLHSCEPGRLQRRNKYADEDFSWIDFFGRVLVQSGTLYVTTYGSVRYVTRVATLPNATLAIDHLAGAYSINAALVTLATLVLSIQPYEWDDSNEETDEYRPWKSEVDTSNAWVYEGFLALIMHLVIWLAMKLRRFIITASPIAEGALSTGIGHTDMNLGNRSGRTMAGRL